MDGLIDGWMDGWINKLMDAWVGGWTDGQYGSLNCALLRSCPLYEGSLRLQTL